MREIATPSLPGFIAACLSLTKTSRSPQAAPENNAQSPLLLVALDALSELITLHPTLFRPFTSQIHSLIYPLIAPTPSNFANGSHMICNTASTSQSARHLFVLLHVTGPKNTAAEEWAKSLHAVIASLQRTADKVFRSLIENRTPPTGSYDVANPNPVGDVVSDQAPTPLPLPAWTGIHAGIERFDGLLHTLQAFLATATAAVVTLPVGHIVHLVDRILSAFPPGNGRNPRLKPEIDRDEREGLWVGLPRLQTSVLGICSLMISRMGHSSTAMTYTILDQLIWSLESQHGGDSFREAAYRLASQILCTSGPSLSKTYAISLSRCIKMCCEDLLPSTESQLQGKQVSLSDAKKTANGVTSSTNADSYLKAANNRVDQSITYTDVHQAARELLTLVLTDTPNEFLPFSLRCQIDRTGIITNNRKIMLASVMNPILKRRGQNQTSSILPLVARAHPESSQVEALLRPQMPLIQSRRSDGRNMDSDEEGDTFMHSYPQADESNGFYQDLADTGASADVEGNIVLGHSDVQKEATSGAIEETSPGTESVSVSESMATGLQEPKSIFSQTSRKRDREGRSTFDTKNSSEGDSTEQVEAEVASKRSRFRLDKTQKETQLETAPSNRAIIDISESGPTVKEIPTSDPTATLDRPSNILQEDSDESEFEMPILHLDSDEDDEQEEEEEADD